MAHITARSAYHSLADRLDRFPQGAPDSELLHAILAMLFSEREAGLVAELPVRSFTAADAARRWRMGEAEALRLLDELAGRAVLLDIDHETDGRSYVLPPPMAGFFEFSLMRVRTDLDQKLLSELFHQYLNVEDDFILSLFTRGETQLGRVFVDEDQIDHIPTLEVMAWERVSEVVEKADHMAVGLCYCRHKMQHLDRACSAPLGICLTFGTVALSLSRHDHVRSIDRAEARDLLTQARDLGLVQFGENVRRDASFICNCCGCCCEAMIAARRFGFLHPVHTTGFRPAVNRGGCDGCGRCVEACPVETMSLISANDPQRPRRRVAHVNVDLCLGCGVCVRACRTNNIKLVRRRDVVLPPETTAHRVVEMAIERGQLQDLIFDNHALASHRAMAAILAVILKLPPLKRALANKQLRSRYVDRLLQLGGLR